MNMNVTVAALQTGLTDDAAHNQALVTQMIREAAGRGAQIILPSELYLGHYFCSTQREEDFARAQPAADHATLREMSALAAELGVVIPVSFFEREGPHYYNSLAVIDADGRNLGVYRKAHIPDGPGYQEKFFFRPGNTPFVPFATRFATVGIGICWDQWFPEVARALVLGGADILFYPTAIGSEPEEPDFDSRDAWQRVMIGHAVANVAPVVAANRVGTEGTGAAKMTFYGSSFICDGRGDKLAELSRTETSIAVATFDVAKIRAARASMGFFRDRRPELYGALTRA